MIVDICDNKTVANTKCLGIRRETVNPWERRAPLAPHHVSKLIECGVKVLVQPSNNRVYPISHIDLAHDYRDCEMAVNALKAAGNEIGQGLMPRSLAPMIFVFTGRGNVSKGAQELFQYLPHEYISVKSLPEVAEFGRADRLYACVVRKEDHLIRKNGGEFNAAEYNRSPHLYISTFAYDVAPYASVIVNGISWAVNSPRLITGAEAKLLLSSQTRINGLDVSGCHTHPHRLLAISDISADPGGSIEFIKECTTIDEPFCIYDSDLNKIADSFHCDSGVLVCSISNLPAQLPMEATNFFGDLLFSYINDMLESDAGQPFEEYNVSPVVRNAVIASNGKLTPNFQYIAALRRQQQATTGEDMKKAMDDNMHPNYEPTNLQQLFHVMDICGRA